MTQFEVFQQTLKIARSFIQTICYYCWWIAKRNYCYLKHTWNRQKCLFYLN